ncbi:GNAT family N-acetyltransferase [Variovorax rhizosphaerae]|uniref:GNAT family N-acetyltransferase n=1 Tax=Variovorax rhizosphaerae TaxID=1836200 RepID=A0ABU8WET4_9BURK
MPHLIQPTLQTQRLILRPFIPSDAEAVRQLAGDHRVAEPTANIPHPYPHDAADNWIASHTELLNAMTGVTFAVTSKDDGSLLGAVSLCRMSSVDQRAELGYWIGFPHWSRGICAEAVTALIDFGHRELQITRVVGLCLARNPGSARVLQKVGFQAEGRWIKHVNHRGTFEDLLAFGLILSGR